MTNLRRVAIAVLAMSMLAVGAAKAANTTDYSDQWWALNESGWGLSVHQQADVIFVSLLVYGTDGKPTWFTAAATLQPGSDPGHAVFTGDLYLTNGSYFPTQWNPAALTYRKVGALAFVGAGPDNATLTYSVDGTQVSKSMIRQTWRFGNIAGTYVGAWNADRTNCIEGPTNETHFEDRLTIIVDTIGDNRVTVTLRYDTGAPDIITGVYAQSGHLGRIDGEFDYLHHMGYIAITEIEVTGSGFTAKFEGDLVSSHWRDWCSMKNGRIGGILR